VAYRRCGGEALGCVCPKHAGTRGSLHSLEGAALARRPYIRDSQELILRLTTDDWRLTTAASAFLRTWC